MTQQLSNQEVAEILNAVDPNKPFGPELHSAIVRVGGGTAIEAVALRWAGDDVEVLLRQRSTTEAAYKGEWHCPGSFVRNGETVVDVLARLTKGESLGQVTNHRFIEPHFWPEERGWVCSLITAVVVDDVGAACSWHPVNKLPDPMVAEHAKVIIPRAVEWFRAIQRRY